VIRITARTAIPREGPRPAGVEGAMAISTFTAWTRDLDRLVDDPVAVADRLRPLLADDGWLVPEHRRPGTTTYRQHLLHVSPCRRLSVVALVWRPGQRTPVHDHVAWCVVGVLSGLEVETRFRLVDHGGRSGLEPTGQVEAWPGHVEAIVPGGDDIHVVEAAGEDLTISIHVYGADIEALGSSIHRRFDHLPVFAAA
jgi:predicted metal-dependent enzyme (double-stranded beta helix superfamily)